MLVIIIDTDVKFKKVIEFFTVNQHHCWVMLELVKSEFLEEAISNVIFKNFEVGQKLEHFTTIEANGC